MPGKHSAKDKRQAAHVADSERGRGMSPERAASVGWATVEARKKRVQKNDVDVGLPGGGAYPAMGKGRGPITIDDAFAELVKAGCGCGDRPPPGDLKKFARDLGPAGKKMRPVSDEEAIARRRGATRKSARWLVAIKALASGYGRVSGGGAIRAANRGDVGSPRRHIVTLPRDADGLCIQPKLDSARRQRAERDLRNYAANHFKYADKYTGNTRTWDPEGRYNCGRCNQVEGSECLLLDIPWVHRERGSCGDWEDVCAGDFEPRTHYKNPKSAGYDIAVVGWSCARCPYAEHAYAADSQGRSLFCRKFGCRVFSDACCVINGAKTVPLDANGLPAAGADKALVPVDRIVGEHRRRREEAKLKKMYPTIIASARPSTSSPASPAPLDPGGAAELS